MLILIQNTYIKDLKIKIIFYLYLINLKKNMLIFNVKDIHFESCDPT
jgi:hypothetical protein